MKKLFLFGICFFIAFSAFSNPIALDGPIRPHLSVLNKFIIYMILTGIIETFVLWCFRYRGWKNLSFIFVVNLISNFLTNICIDYWKHILRNFFGILLLETLVVLFEYLLLGIRLKYTKKLFWTIVVANLVSFFIGRITSAYIIDFINFCLSRL